MTKTVTIKGTVRQEIKDRLAAIAREQGRATDDDLVAEAVETFVAAYDQEAAIVAARLDKALSGGPCITGEDMEAFAGSLGSDKPLPRPGAATHAKSR